MSSPFPGMNPYLEHPDRWSTVHNRLIVALADFLTPQLLPKYQVDIDKRIYEVILEEVREAYLEVKEVATQVVVTAIEILSPTNKKGDGRQKYEQKRQHVLNSRTHLVEIDLLRDGAPLPIAGTAIQSRYRVLVSRSDTRPLADFYPFNVPDPMPPFPLPLQADDVEPVINLRSLLDDVYERSGYDYFIDYHSDPLPPLSEAELNWIDALLRDKGLR